MAMVQQAKAFFHNKPLISYQGDTYVLKEKVGFCGVCGKKTNYKSSFAAEYCCSEECSKELWYEIFFKMMTDRRRKR